eukprot:TRINITY_DN5861_c0_g1_i1.p1 TRINITY_DN5861_c0_g1~~TRINITY_DN5861_c0_g1_i1.p1  ORF type:complete len:467 (-),score=66.23 TRINITY_DN5861_c0_g1_i1:27-1427(-)
MPGSDMVIGVITDSGPSITDRYALAFSTPFIDDCQSWTLVSGSKSAGQVFFEVSRKLDTGDTQDRVIPPGPVRILYATGASQQLSYHGATRGATMVRFYDSTSSTKKDRTKKSEFETVQTAKFLMPDVKVPPAETTYMCASFVLPDISDGHIIQVDPVIDVASEDANPDFVHHMLIHICDVGQFWQKYITPDVCFSPLGNLGTGCNSLLYAWAVGMDSLILPPQAGFRIGNESSHGIVQIIIEIHYNNVHQRTDIVDRSGIRIHYTPTLRQYDAGVMTLGDVVVKLPDISAHTPYIEYETDCPSQCTSQWAHSITVFADFQHMHQIGKQMWTTHWRGDKMIGYLNRVDFYSFDFQQNTPMNIEIQPGDRFNIHCAYDSSSRSSVTKFGESSQDEMCMEFISYYPIITTDQRPYVFCGYVRDRTNVGTWCGDINTRQINWNLKNPSIKDPAGTGTITFGKKPTVCPV